MPFNLPELQVGPIYITRGGRRVRLIQSPHSEDCVTAKAVDGSDFPTWWYKKSGGGQAGVLSEDCKHSCDHLDRLEKAARLSKSDRELLAAQAKVDALKAKAAARQKAAEDRAKKVAEAKAKAEREKRLKGLSKSGRRAVEMLAKDPSSFGCQRASVIALASALTGDDLAAALA